MVLPVCLIPVADTGRSVFEICDQMKWFIQAPFLTDFMMDLLQDRLWHQLCGETDASCVISISKLLVVYYLDQPLRTSISLDAGLCPDDLGVLRSRFENLAIVQAALFPVEALVLSGQFCQHAACVTATDRCVGVCVCVCVTVHNNTELSFFHENIISILNLL